MPRSRPGDAREPVDVAVDRAADHASIDRLTDELLPALIAKLGATGLGELEVREGGWRVRLRRPAGDGVVNPSPARERKAGDRGGGERSEGAPDRAGERAPRTLHRPLEAKTARTDSRAVATSPAVGIYRSRPEEHMGFRFQHNIVHWTQGPLMQGGGNQVEFTRNLYAGIGQTAFRVGDQTWEQWRALGQDEGSIFADPGFTDPAHDNFTLNPTPPLQQIGFQPFDPSTAGPRQAD